MGFKLLYYRETYKEKLRARFKQGKPNKQKIMGLLNQLDQPQNSNYLQMPDLGYIATSISLDLDNTLYTRETEIRKLPTKNIAYQASNSAQLSRYAFSPQSFNSMRSYD